jgi:hypothetical protein
MREIRSSGSEGGVADSGHPYPYRRMPMSRSSEWARATGTATPQNSSRLGITAARRSISLSLASS